MECNDCCSRHFRTYSRRFRSASHQTNVNRRQGDTETCHVCEKRIASGILNRIVSLITVVSTSQLARKHVLIRIMRITPQFPRRAQVWQSRLLFRSQKHQYGSLGYRNPAVHVALMRCLMDNSVTTYRGTVRVSALNEQVKVASPQYERRAKSRYVPAEVNEDEWSRSGGRMEQRGRG